MHSVNQKNDCQSPELDTSFFQNTGAETFLKLDLQSTLVRTIFIKIIAGNSKPTNAQYMVH